MARMTNGDSEAKSAGINKNNFTYLCAQLASMCYPIRVTNGGSEAKSAGINKNNFIYLCAQLAYGCYLVRITGVEPARTCVHMDLNHARLPIPPYPQNSLPSHYIILKKNYQHKKFMLYKRQKLW